MPSFSLEYSEFEDGRGYVVIRQSDGQRLQWRTLPKSSGLESVNVVGEKYYGAAVADPSFGIGRSLVLQRQPQNQFDSNAIAVWNADNTLQVGYIPREEAKRLARAIDKGQSLNAYSIWETRDRGHRTDLRLLLVKKSASIALDAMRTR